MGGGAWPFLAGGAICLVDSVNERDLNLLTSRAVSERWIRQVPSSSGRGGLTGSGRKARRLLRGTLGVSAEGRLRQ